MRFYWPIAKLDAEQRVVWGYASTEALDDQGERVTRAALAAALDDYMRFANIREMHQNSAVGVAQQAEIDDRGLYLAAKIVDDDAWRKVVEGVYKGFSIGGRVTARDASDRALITGLTLTEISVVDRPANPEAVFDCWKLAADAPVAASPASGKPHSAGREEQPSARRLARIIVDLEWLHDCIGSEARQQQIRDSIAELSNFVAALIASGGERDDDDQSRSAGGLAAAAVALSLRKAQPRDLEPLAADLAKLAQAIMPRLDALQKRVEDIASTPLPPQTVARGFALAPVSKREDGGAASISGDEVIAALARMTAEERTLAVIKAARASPIAPFGGPATTGR